MQVLPDHYKGPQATSKGHTPLLIPFTTMGKCKQVKKINFNYSWVELAWVAIQGHPILSQIIIVVLQVLVPNLSFVTALVI